MIVSLKADGSLPKKSLLAEFSQNYTFFDNQAVFSDLVQAIQDKYQRSEKNGTVYIHFTEEEVQELFSGANLTEEEMGLLIEDLK